jgi:hypothetical protein
LIVTGWITAFFFPPVGIGIGIWLSRTYERQHGVAMAVVASVMLVLWSVAGATG